MSPRAAAIALATLALALVGVATAALATERPAEVGRMAASGAVQLNGPGGAILGVQGMRPGQSVRGTVALRNDGDAAGRLTLERTALTDVPGRGGGSLSQALQLWVEELGSGPPQDVYLGSLTDATLLDLGTISGQRDRVFRLTVTLPDTGRPAGPLAGDNAFLLASTRIDWTWVAESDDPEPTPTPTATPTSTPDPEPTAEPPVVTPPPPTVVGGGGAPQLTLRIPRQVVLKSKGIMLFGRCDEPCGIRFAAQIATSPKKKARKARVLMRRNVFHGARTERRLAAGAEQAIRLKLTRKALKTLKRTLRSKRRAAVIVTATVRGSGGTGTVRRRIVLINRGSVLRR